MAFLPGILLLTQAPIIAVVYGSIVLLSYIITTFLVVYCIVFCFCCVWWSGMTANVSV